MLFLNHLVCRKENPLFEIRNRGFSFIDSATSRKPHPVWSKKEGWGGKSNKLLLKAIFSMGVFIGVFLFSVDVRAETFILKNGKTLNGTVTERTSRYIKIDIGIGVPVTYYLDEIEKLGESFSQNSDGELKKKASSFLWEVVSGNSKVYLLGSIHLAKPSMYPLKPSVEQSFDQSDFLVVEVDLEHIDELEAQSIMLQKALYLDGDQLSNHVSQETWSKLAKVLPKYDLDLSQVMSFKPWYISIYLTLMQVKKLGFSEEYGIDRYFLRKVNGLEKIIELESIDYQISMFESLPDQNLLLEYTLADLAQTEKMLNQLILSWETGDAVGMNKLVITDTLAQYPKLLPIYKKLLFERNEAMTEKIKGFLQTGNTYFVVVGAGHLVGDNGIIALLKKKGYKIEQL